MIEVTPIFEAVGNVMQPEILVWVLIGLTIGILVGAIPGVGSVLGMSIVLPLTIPLGGLEANILLVSIFSGAMYGSSISAILLRVPGTAAAAATLLDGHPLTEKGLPKYALSISATSSALGGGLTILVLLLLIPIMGPIVMLFGAPQIFLVALFGILMIGVVASQGSFLKGVTAGVFGVLVMTIGISPASPGVRFTFDSVLLWDGLDYVAILIGMFAIGEMIRIAAKPRNEEQSFEDGGSIASGAVTTVRNYGTMIKSGFIGMVVGAIPGAGSSASNFFAYAEAVRSSPTKEKESFGQGNPKGVVAAEASNNGTVAGSLMPVIAFGIPGSAATAVLLGGFLLHGVNPGAELFTTNISFTYSLIIALLLGNVLILVFGLLVVPYVGAAVTQLDTDIIVPIVVVLATVGAFSLRSNWVDIATLLIFGVIAFLMYRHDYSVIAMVIGAVLADIIEVNLQRSLALSNGSPLIFINDPLSITIIVVMSLLMLSPKLKELVERRRSQSG
jgi:putative tricarboxylic transport membrane protein